jgi:hypothetical protein
MGEGDRAPNSGLKFDGSRGATVMAVRERKGTAAQSLSRPSLSTASEIFINSFINISTGDRMSDKIKKMFERRPFTPKEREDMKELYGIAETLALRIEKQVPAGLEKELALVKIKEVLAFCEAAVAMNPELPKYSVGPEQASCGVGGGIGMATKDSHVNAERPY